MTTRQKRMAARYSLMAVSGLAAGVIISSLVVSGSGRFPLAVTIPIIGGFCGLVLLACAPYMSKLDGRERSARQTSWYWGGFFGLLFGFFTANAVGGLHPGHWSDWSKSACLMAVVQLGSYYVARLIWWRKNRVVSS